MPEKIYFYLLILCGILSQGIIGTVGDENEEPSDILVRQKRVISAAPGEDVTTSITDVPYVVMVKRNRRITCVGSILSVYVVITSAKCINYLPMEYEVFSGTSRVDYGTIHRVVNVTKRFYSHPSRSTDGIALLTIISPFIYGTHTNFIQLHSEPLFSETIGLICGWGFNCGEPNSPPPKLTRKLRAIAVKIMAHRDCVNRYRAHNIEIFEEDVCTYHEQRHCGHTDGGAPLIIDGHLAGVHLWTGPAGFQIDPAYPEVFAVLQNSYFYHWIRTTMQHIEAQFHNRYHN